VSSIRPWHYDDLFFQEVPKVFEIDVDRFYRGRDILDIVERFYSGLDLEVGDIIARSDLYEKQGKDQHAFCTDIDRKGDIRILANIKDDEMWTGTMLHELGHAVYDKYIDPGLPFLLRHQAHIFVTEAIAMMFGRLSKNADWLHNAAGIDKNEAEAAAGELTEHLRIAQLIFARWAQVMMNFERLLYKDPDRDLNDLWWGLVEKYQMVSRPDDREAPDWATKTHVVSVPVYYHNYLLGELLASQLTHHIRAEFTGDQYPMGPDVGGYLKEMVFKPGARFRWDRLVERATGERLTARHFAEEFVG
jgi:peptidyl-dipeptidase A